MPIFEYECEKCGVFDVLQKGGEKPLKFCPNCAEKKKKSKVVKKVSSPAFHLKGTGWYKTDYANPSANAESASGTKSAKKVESKSSAPKAKEAVTKEASKSAKSESSSTGKGA